MAREYNINEIEFEDNDDTSKAELLTGEYLKGISKGNSLQPNTEVEKDEYIKFPDQSVVKAVGGKHEEGGIDVAIPDGTEVISDNLKPTKKQKKEIEKMFDITVSDSDTYAKLVAKFTKKIGLEKLNDDQAKTFEKLEILTKNTSIPKATAEVNLEYLSSKIKQLEDKKKAVEPQRKSFFDYIYGLQQDSKSPSEKDNTFKYGGTQIQEIAKQFNIPEDKVKSFLENGGKKLPQYVDGNPKKYKKEELPQDAEINTSGKAYKVGQYVPQEDGTYLKVTTVNLKPTPTADTKTSKGPVEDWIAQSDENRRIADQANAIIEAGIAKKQITKDGKGNLKISGNFKPDFKERIILSQVINQSGPRFGTDKYKIATQSFTPGYSDAKGTGSFVAGFTPEDYEKRYVFEKLKGEGLTQDEAFTKLDELYQNPDTKKTLRKEYVQFLGIQPPTNEAELMSDDFYKKNYSAVTKGVESKLEASGYRPAIGDDALSGFEHFDAFGFTANPEYEKTSTIVQEQKTEGKEPEEKTTVGATTPIEDLVAKYLYQKPNVPRAFYTPDQTPLPPTPVQPVLKTDLNFGRIDPVRVGIETQLREVENQNRFVASQLEGMPETQKASALAMMMANSNESINKAATSANQINAQNISSAELFNIGQADKEAVYDRNSDTVFQNTMFAAQAKAEEQLRRFYDQMNKVNITNLQNNQKLNLIDSVFPDYSLDFSGSRVNFDPENPNAPLIRDSFLNRTLGVIGQ